MASTWQSIVSSPAFASFSPEKQNAVRRDYFQKYTTPEDLQTELERLSTLHGVNPSLTKAIATIESNWDAQAKSPKGATGIMQLMPPTAGDRAKDMGIDVKEVLNNPSFNMEAGVRHLKYLLKRYDGDEKKAAQAYNWGEGNLEKKGELAAPQETKNYIGKLEKELGRVPTTADVPYGIGKAGKRIVQPVEDQEDLTTIRNIDPNIFQKEGEPTIPLTYKNTGREMGEVPFIRGENKENNTFDIVTKPIVDIEEEVGPPIPRKRNIPHPYEKFQIPSPIDVGKKLIGDLPEQGQKALGRGIKLLTGMNPISAIPGNLAGQYIENPRELPSLTEAVASELTSLIPGGSGLVKGGLTGVAQSIVNNLVQEGKLPDLQDALNNGMLGAFLGKFLPSIKKSNEYPEPLKPYEAPPSQDVEFTDITNTPLLEHKSPYLSIDDTRPIGQSQTQFERRDVSPIQGRGTEDITRGKTGPIIPQDYKKDIIEKDPFNEKIASQFKEGRGRANEFGAVDELEKEGIRNNPALQSQSEKIKSLSKGHEFGAVHAGMEDTPPIPRILPSGKPTVLTQVGDKIKALRESPSIPLPKEEISLPQRKREKLDEILSQYESHLKGKSQPTQILPPGPPSHLASIKQQIESMKKVRPFSLKEAVEDVHSKVLPPKEDVVIPSPEIKTSTKKSVTKNPPLPPKINSPKIPKTASKEEGLSALRKQLEEKKKNIPHVVDDSYIKSLMRTEDFDKYLKAAQNERDGVQAYQLAAERFLTRQQYPKEFIAKVKSKIYELAK